MLLVHISSVAVVGEECLLPRRRFGFVMLELPFRGDALQHFAEMAVATARLPVTNTITLPSPTKTGRGVCVNNLEAKSVKSWYVRPAAFNSPAFLRPSATSEQTWRATRSLCEFK